MERPCGPHVEQHPREKTWLTSNVLHKRLAFPGEEKEILAFRTDSLTTRQSVKTATLTMERLCRPGGAGQPERSNEGLVVPGHVDDPSFIAPKFHLFDDEDGAGSPVPGRSRQWKRCRTSRAPPIDLRRDKQRHARPGRAADKDCADNREGLAPAVGRHADMGEPKRRVVACDGGRHGEEERDCGADERRPYRAKAICPSARVTPPARTPTTSAPMTPEPLWKAASPAVRPAKNGSA